MEKSKLMLLAVLAHPDDESFGLGGTLALYAERGVETHLVCATRGEVGTVDAEHLEGYASIAERRVDELRCAAGILGLNGVHFLDYRDSGMPGSPDNSHPQALAAAPLDEVAGKIVGYIRRLQPQVVLTFDPIGGYKHPDHIAIQRATLQAFHLAGDAGYITEDPPFQPQKLYYQVIPKGFLRIAVRLLPLFGRDPRRFGRNADIDLMALVEEGISRCMPSSITGRSSTASRRRPPATRARRMAWPCAGDRCAGWSIWWGGKSITCAPTPRRRRG